LYEWCVLTEGFDCIMLNSLIDEFLSLGSPYS
jgi:hypothetical protein